METRRLTSGLVLCATPIGNLEDVSFRALRSLSEADIVACEDTRRTRKLLSHHGVEARRLVSYHDGNERARARYLTERMAAGDLVVLVTDAGTPGLSDPGYRLVQACIAAGLQVEAVPGPSAAITALTLSGLPPARFVFEGFLPRRTSERRRHIDELLDERRTLVFYESPHRLAASLTDLAAVLGDRPAAVARELTKLHEEVRRGSLTELAAWAERETPKGEIVIVVAGAVGDHRAHVDPAMLAAAAQSLMDSGVGRREALARVAHDYDVRKREVFDALVEVRQTPDPG